VVLRKFVDERRDRLCDDAPIRRRRIARGADRVVQRAQAVLVAQLRQAGASQQQAQRGVPQCGLVEPAQVRVAAAGPP
jgi:hypothetical protein